MVDSAALHGDGLPGAITHQLANDIFDAVREPLLVLDANLQVQAANTSFFESFGMLPEETVGHLVYDLGNRQWNVPALHALLEDVLPDNHAFNNFVVEHDFGKLGSRTLLLNARRIDHVQLVLLAFEDITERQKALGALQDSELRYRRLFEAAQDGILILDAVTGQIIDANPYIEVILGYSRANLLGQRLWDVGLLADMRENEAKFRELQAHGYVRYDHLPLEAPNGTATDVEFVSNVYEVNGRQVVQCNIRDISERRRLERQTESQAAELIELDHRKDEFLSMLSHELRNPLGPIVNAVHLLRLQSDHNSIQRNAMEVLDRQTANLTRLVDDLLEVSRITTGRIRLQRERVELAGIAQSALEATRSEFEIRNQRLTVVIPPEAIWFDGDSARVEQVIVNLLTNASKYTNEGGQVTLTLEAEANTAILRVKDTGIGIADDDLSHIFDLFTQAKRSLARSAGGLGIGLALVRGLAELHGGSVSVSSVVGQGSEFVVRLPISPASAAPQPESGLEPTKTVAPEPLKILVVDDNVDMSRMFQLTFQLDGHRVRVAHDGPTALQAAIEFSPQVVLLDIGLPGWDGYEVARRIREEPLLASIVIVAMTGYGRDTDRLQASAAGFDHHMVKPPDFAKLADIFATVAKQIDNRP